MFQYNSLRYTSIIYRLLL